LKRREGPEKDRETEVAELADIAAGDASLVPAAVNPPEKPKEPLPRVRMGLVGEG